MESGDLIRRQGEHKPPDVSVFGVNATATLSVDTCPESNDKLADYSQPSRKNRKNKTIAVKASRLYVIGPLLSHAPPAGETIQILVV